MGGLCRHPKALSLRGSAAVASLSSIVGLSELEQRCPPTRVESRSNAGCDYLVWLSRGAQAYMPPRWHSCTLERFRGGGP